MDKPRSITIILLWAVGFLVLWQPAFAENPMRIATDENVVSIHKGQRVLLRYRYEHVPFKPYVQQLFSPRGVNVLLDAPPDHLHHHALMFAVAVDGLNFWEEQKRPGRQMHRRFREVRIDQRNDVHYGSFVELLDWVDPSSEELLLRESRTIELCQLEAFRAALLTWRSELEVPPGTESVTLTGSHYFGLGMRFLESMDVGGQFRNAEGKTGEVVRGDERLVRANWCAYTARANGKPVTIAMFGHPDNLRHPTQWFTMTKPFAYLSATLNLHKEPLEVISDKPLLLRYAVVLWDNRPENEHIEQVYNWWLDSK